MQGICVAKTQLCTCSVTIKNPDDILQAFGDFGVISVILPIRVYVISLSEW